MRNPDELRELVEQHLHGLGLSGELGGLGEAMRYAMESGGKRIRPVLCLATGEAAGAAASDLLPAAAAVELVHTFSLVHDDLPALDDDALRRGRESAHVRFGEAVAILAGDALLAEAFRLALGYETPAVARELAAATVGMIGGQYADVTDGAAGDVVELHRLKTGRLFTAAVGCALWVASVPESNQAPWRRFADELGVLFQVVDDILDGDGYAERHGAGRARLFASEAAARACAHLDDILADTSILAAIVDSLAARTS